MTNASHEPKVLIIGAGMSGMLMAIRLLKAGITSFEIIEKAAQPGGTWRENTYPGLQCDVPGYMYAYSFEPNPECTRRFANGHELQAYFLRVFEKYALAQYTRFNTKVISANWQHDNWTVVTDDGMRRHADFVVAASGILHNPKMPDIPGLDSFRGVAMHSAQWQHDVPLAGKRVGVVGTGSTSVQIVAAIAADVGHLDVYQRTAQWIVPARDVVYGKWRQPVMRRAPFLARWIALGYEKAFDNITGKLATNPLIAPTLEVIARANLRLSVKDPVLRNKLTPDYRAGCKRLIIADHFYSAMQKPNVELVTDGIERVEKDGIRTRDGKLHKLDVLVLATGFHTNFCWPIEFTGRDGKSLSSIWEKRITAYRSLTVPGFPNLFFLPGPHSPFGNFSIINVSEIQTNYIMQLIEKFRRGDAVSFEPREDATTAYNEAMKEAVKGTVWTSGCQSWYLDAEGIPILWPWSFDRFRQEMRRPVFEDFIICKRDVGKREPDAKTSAASKSPTRKTALKAVAGRKPGRQPA